MKTINKYLEIENKLNAQVEDNSIDITGIPEEILLLTKIFNGRNYFLHSYYKKSPKVILIGYSHRYNKINQEEELFDIFRSILNINDIILAESNKPAEIIYGLYSKCDLFGRLKEYLKSLNVRTIFNDDNLLIADMMIINSQLEKMEKTKGYDLTDEIYKSLIEEHMELLRKRDDNFSFNNIVGIVPLIKGTAKIYSPPSKDARYYQLVGLSHIYANYISNNLIKEDISFVTFITTAR